MREMLDWLSVTSLTIFLRFENFALILEHATQLAVKAPSKPDEFLKDHYLTCLRVSSELKNIEVPSFL